jgi:diguanylate cyclase (GGDEF)-like protein
VPGHHYPSGARYVLIAEPNTSRAAALRRAVVEHSGRDAVVVRDGAQALDEVARRGVPGLLLTDLSLAKIDGFALIREIRKQASWRSTSVIALSAHHTLRAAAQALSEQLGIARVLPLDIDAPAFRDALDLALPATDDLPPVSREYAESDVPVGTSDGMRIVVDFAARRMADVMSRYGVAAAVMYLRVDEDERFLTNIAAHMLPPRAVHSLDWPFLQQFGMDQEPLVVPDLRDHPIFDRIQEHGGVIRGFVGIPLPGSHRNVVGALFLMDGEPLTLGAADVDQLTVLVGEISREIGRQIRPLDVVAEEGPTDTQFQALQRLAVTDPLTGLLNRRGGEKNIASEIARAGRHRTPLSCILLDIDRFKEVNDTWGHQVGDQVLRSISDLLRRSVRAYDILVRWGGEEFLIALPGVHAEQARRLAERVRASIAAMPSPAGSTVTISAGTATLGPKYNFESMVSAADRALYQAKASGRNCVVEAVMTGAEFPLGHNESGDAPSSPRRVP